MANRRLGTQSGLDSQSTGNNGLQAPREACRLFDIPIHDVTAAQTVALIDTWIGEGGVHQVATVNPEFLMKTRQRDDFRTVLQGASLCLADGIGVVLAARFHGYTIRERVAGSDLVPLLSQYAADKGWRVFYLGAAPGVAEKTAQILQARFPGLQVAGCYAGSPAQEEDELITARIREACSDLVLVAYGAPNQDLWIARNLERSGAPVGIGVGGSFDFVAGIAKRAPRWLQRLGLEWLYRLIREPWRWKRQLVLPHFALLTLLKGTTVTPPHND